MDGYRMVLGPAAVLAVLACFAARAAAVETGASVPEVTLRRVDGGSAPLVERGPGVTAVLFLKGGQERSLATVREMARCQATLAGKPVRWVGLVPGDSVPAEVRAMVEEGGMKLPVLVDEGDAVYARLSVRAHPGVAVVDRAGRLVAYESFHQVEYCDVVLARIRGALGELTPAEVQRAFAPPASQLPGEEPGGVAMRQVSFGRKLLAGKAYAQAHESARKALALAPSAAAWTLEGEIFRAEGRCADAAKAFDAALALDPRHGPAAEGKRGCGR